MASSNFSLGIAFLTILELIVPLYALNYVNLPNFQLDRRTAISFVSSCLLVIGPSSKANAACLPGDESADCIGFYKVPLDDEILPYVETPEELEKVAPGLRWVPRPQPPKTYKEAWAEINSLKTRCFALDDVIMRGDFTEAGVELLRIMPRVTLSGRVLVQSLASTKSKTASQSETADFGLRALRVEAAYTQVLSKLNACDILLGQALRDELGSTTAAQILILAELHDANSSWEELQGAVPQDLQRL
eukprot:CAMPEP_0194254476 /NCGR_PEP_ID=MMETSP0158-20130606/32277_1 /TAXON_ID=33649 /ORGANISM="Thalassionema nitzschioides, Strain L26-B" /LENGTH=246 /DNA_ID=CAMNT_0038992525 /DNA_START=36 /DNA_END=776 /DNA_ORIENTATION=+